MKKCNHNWRWLMPEPIEVKEDIRINYSLEINVLGGNLSTILFCDKCLKTGSYIKSSKGGVRKHSTDYFTTKANKLKEKYGIKI